MSGKIHALSGVIGDRHRQVVHAVVDEIIANPGEEYGLQLMKPTSQPAAYLIHEKISGFGGMTQERNFGDKGKAVSAGSSKTRIFQPGSYQEHVPFNERDLLMLRRLGSIGERGATGLTSGELDHMSRAAMKLERRLKNRMNKLAWDALFNGSFVWKGQTTSFDVPGANALTAATDWSDRVNGKPFSDLWTIQSTNVIVRKYSIKEFVINPKTAADILMSAEAQNVLRNFNVKANDLNGVAQFLYPTLAPIRVVKDGWQDESLAADGSIVMGDHAFFVPDDKVLIVPDFGGYMYPQFGEIQITENLNDPSATLEKPAQGIYTFLDEKGLEDREAPRAKIVAGFNGGANLLRSDDVMTISV